MGHSKIDRMAYEARHSRERRYATVMLLNLLYRLGLGDYYRDLRVGNFLERWHSRDQ